MPRMMGAQGKAKKGTTRRLIKMVCKGHPLGVFLCLFFVVVMAVGTVASPILVERITSRHGLRQLTYMKELGMGNDKYVVIDLDKE